MPHTAQTVSYCTQLIWQYRDTGGIRDRRGRPANAFSRRYTEEDAIALAKMDTLHGDTDRNTVICVGRLRFSVAPCCREAVLGARRPIPSRSTTE